jgi:Icc-related predicted phosphoesterase
VPDECLIVVSHTPPAGCLDLAIRFAVRHIGSHALADFVATYQPAWALCGHVHSQGGHVAPTGRTLVVNAASDDQRQEGALSVCADWTARVLP